jgi:protein TonB
MLIVFLALFFTTEKRAKEVSPFFAHIVTPEELTKKSMSMPKELPSSKKEALTKMPKMPKNVPPPKDISSVPSKKNSKQSFEDEQNSKIRTQSQFEESEGKEGKIIAKSQDRASIKEGIDNIDKNKTSNQNFKEKFFDKEIIGQLTKRHREEPNRQESTITFDTKEYKYYGYLQRLKEKIEGIWRYPPDAAEKGIYGDLYIRFTIQKNGRLGSVELLRTSGHKSLDDAAIKALKDAEPYWPLPDEWGKEGFTITGHFIYSLYGTYIR